MGGSSKTEPYVLKQFFYSLRDKLNRGIQMAVLTCECAATYVSLIIIISAQRQKATPTLIDWNMNIIKVQFLLEPPTELHMVNNEGSY